MSAQATLLARKSLGLEDDPSKAVPVSYLRAVDNHLRRFPGDDHFIIELAEESGTGGNGFGTVTCMEDFCWVDINLDSDPAKADGGKAEGFGSLFNFQMHCTEEKHVKARDARLKNAGRPIPPRVMPQQLHEPAPTPPQPLAHRPPPVPALASSFGPMRQAQGPSAVDWTGSHHAHGAATRQPPLASSSSSSSSSSNPPSLPPSQRYLLSSSPASSSFGDTPYTYSVPTASGRYQLSSSPGPRCTAGLGLGPCDCGLCGPVRHRHSTSSSHKSKKRPVMSVHTSTTAIPPAKSFQSAPARAAERPYDTVSHSLPYRSSSDLKPVITTAPALAAARPALANLPPNVPPTFHPLWTSDERSLLRSEEKLLNDYISGPLARTASKEENVLLFTRVGQLNGMIRGGPPYIPSTEQLRRYQPVLRTIALGWDNLKPAVPPPPRPSSAGIIDRVNSVSASALAGPSSIDALTALSRDDPAYWESMRKMADYDQFEDRYGYGHGYGPRGSLRMSKDDLEQFFSSALNDFDSDSTVEDALKALNMPSLTSKFADLTITLMPHQIIGVAFMLEKEKAPKFKGGLLCDAMGLGKTVQTIGAIVGHKSEDRKVKTTLVVAPLALLQQWKTEILNKTTANAVSVLIHHGPQRTKRIKDLQKYDVVLTTYGTLVSEYGKEPKPKTKKKDSDGESFSEDEEIRIQGPIFKMRFWRVVLDEAHFIRNRTTRNAKAVWDLKAEHRWSVTGTLVVNGLMDIFPHLRFLSISRFADLKHFNEKIGKLQKSDPKTATTRSQAILKTCMLRRHKDSTLNGVRLLNLPERKVEVVELDFTEEERAIYIGIEKRMQIRFNSFLRKGTVMKHYACILVMLLRLRQLTCHPYLLRRDPADATRHPEDFVISDDELLNNGVRAASVDDATELERAERLCGEAFVQKVKEVVSEREARLEAASKSVAAKAPKQERGVQEVEEHECPICFDNLSDPVVTPCLHIFCHTCIEEVCSTETIDTSFPEVDIARGVRPCPLCRGPIEKTKLFKISAFSEQKEPGFDNEDEVKLEKKPDLTILGMRNSPIEISSDEDEPVDKKPKLSQDWKGKAKAEPEPEPEPESEGSRPTVDAAPTTLDEVDGIVPSTKMKHMGELVETFLQEDDIKIVIFSQFVSFLDLLGAYLRERQVGYCTYQGSMKTHERDDMIRQFNSVEDWAPRVMLISLKCGGVGLNLTVASKAICLDMAWNAATEAQAWDRLHRIGQTRPVLIKRVVIADTVEQRIMKLQEEKSALADGAMGEGAVGKLGRLSVNDLCRLFAVARE